MPITKLASSTALLIQSSQNIPSYEAAVLSVLQNSLIYGAHHIVVTLLPSDLSFTVSDHGPGISRPNWLLMLQPACTSQTDATGCSLASLAAVSSLNLQTRCDDFHATKLVRAGNLVECSLRDTSLSHDSLLSHNGLVVNVQHMFEHIPVRRWVEQEKGPLHILHAIRRRIIALSLANPNVAITLIGENDVLYYKSIPREHLTVNMIHIAFGDAHGIDWQPVHAVGPAGCKLKGFIARKGSRNAEMQIFSVNKIPIESKGWVHKRLKKVWTKFIMRFSKNRACVNKMPAYILNCSGSARAVASFIHLEEPVQLTPFMKILEHAVQNALQIPAMKHNSLPDANRDLRVSLHVVNSKRKRDMVGRFSDAKVNNKRIRKPPPSLWSSKDTCEVLKRPFSRDQKSLLRNETMSQQMLRSSRISIQRPISAEAVEYSYRTRHPEWANPCFTEIPHKCRKTVMEPKRRCQINAGFERRATAIPRDTIKELRIVGQVDKKFIVVVHQTTLMYAIDQHAASERFMYEALQKNIPAKVFPSTLQTPERVALSRLQMETASRICYHLQRWGWTLRTGTSSTEVDMIQVPRIDGINIILGGAEHLRRYLDDVQGGALSQATPKPIVEAIASAACHSAVRFGDVLTRKQCESVVWSLAECESPFLCAHGRPSIVPLAVFEQ